MVTHSHSVIASGIHELNRALALIGAHQGLTHDGIACGEQKHLGAGSFKVLLQLRYAGHTDG